MRLCDGQRELAPFDFAPLARRYAQDERNFSLEFLSLTVRPERSEVCRAKSKGANSRFLAAR